MTSKGKEMNKTAYLSGPMRGFPQWNFPAFDRNAAFLREQGWTIISPAEVDRELGFDETDETAVFTEADFEVAIRRDYVALTQADAIIFMPGWEKSTGARLESNFANVLKLERYRVDADTNYFEKELLIGLTGYAQTGKDTLANLLVQKYGFDRRGFADALKGILYSLNPILPAPNWAEVGDEFGTAGVVRVKDYVDAFGWEESKKIPEVRQLLQRLGTEGGRQNLGEQVWVDGLFNKPHGARLVVPDVRFPNEVESIQKRGGIIIRVNREGYGPINGHISETASLDQEDFSIQNDDSPETLLEKAVSGLLDLGVTL